MFSEPVIGTVRGRAVQSANYCTIRYDYFLPRHLRQAFESRMISSTASYPLNALRRCTSLASAAKRIHSSCVQILPEVAEALRGGRPGEFMSGFLLSLFFRVSSSIIDYFRVSSVVALESTIVAHGMPYPQNLELAKDVSQILRSKVHS